MTCLATLALAAGLASGAQSALSVTHAARSVRPGELVVLTITAAAPHPITVRAFGRSWPANQAEAGTWRALIGIDLATKPGRHEIIVTSGDARASHPLVVQARTFPTRRLKVDPALVTPPPEARDRIEREARELAAAWESSSAEPLWSGGFVDPVPDPANSAFGTHSVYNGVPRSQHSGADFASPTGRPVKAPNAGRIVLAGSRYFTGNTVLIDHGQGLFSLMAHLSDIDVKVGASIATGDVIGKVGATGRVTGPHLHWTVRINGARIDPVSLLHVLGAR
jgi:hypothetical protein